MESFLTPDMRTIIREFSSMFSHVKFKSGITLKSLHTKFAFVKSALVFPHVTYMSGFLCKSYVANVTEKFPISSVDREVTSEVTLCGEGLWTTGALELSLSGIPNHVPILFVLSILQSNGKKGKFYLSY